MLAGSGAAVASTSTCGSGAPTGGVPISSFAQLQQDLASSGAAGSTYYLTKSIADSTATPGGLVIPAESGEQSVDIDLNGCGLRITHPGAGTSAITVAGPGEVAQLTISDAPSGGGTLTAIGGSSTTTTAGGGAGIAVGAPTGAMTVPGLMIEGGTVTATGGNADTGATNYSGAGAGIGGPGGRAGHYGEPSAGIQVDTGGTVVATGGTTTGSSEDEGGGGAGIGGGGEGAQGGAGNLAGSSYLDGGSIRATGGGANSSGMTDGAGAGFGGGGGYGTEADGNVLESTGGSLAVTAGSTTGSQALQTVGADGFGLGSGTETPNGQPPSRIDLLSGTTTVSGQIYNEIDAQPGAALRVPAKGTLTITGYNQFLDYTDPYAESSLSNLTLPASATLDLNGYERLTLSGTIRLSGTVNVSDQSYLIDTGRLTLAGTNPAVNELTIDSGATLTIPSGATTSIASGDDNFNDGTITVAGTLTGASGAQLANDGAIILTGSGSIPGHGIDDNELTVTDSIYDVTFSTPSGTPPAPRWVYADTFADDKQSLPAEPAQPGKTRTGWFDANGTRVTNTSKLAASPEGANDTVALTAGYTSGS